MCVFYSVLQVRAVHFVATLYFVGALTQETFINLIKYELEVNYVLSTTREGTQLSTQSTFVFKLAALL